MIFSKKFPGKFFGHSSVLQKWNSFFFRTMDIRRLVTSFVCIVRTFCCVLVDIEEDGRSEAEAEFDCELSSSEES